MTIETDSVELQHTPRRENWEFYARFLLNKADVNSDEAEKFLNEKQEVLHGYSPLELIYTGRYVQGAAAVEIFADSLTIEDL